MSKAFAILMILQSFPTWASDYHSPRTAALGGAGHASPLLNDAIYLNPSYVSFLNTYGLSANYFLYNGTTDNPSYNGHGFNVSAQDGSPEQFFQAGVGFTRREDANFVHVGASKSVIQKLGVGIGSKFVFSNDPAVSPNMVTDFTVSSTGLAFDWLQVSILADNVLESQAGVSRGMLREFLIGTKINIMSLILIYVDPHWVPSLTTGAGPWGVEAGVEIPFFTDFFLRAGKFQNARIPTQNAFGDGWGVGAGWLAPKISLDYGFETVTAPTTSLVHQFGFTIFF